MSGVSGAAAYPATLSELDIAFCEAERLEAEAVAAYERAEAMVEGALDGDDAAEDAHWTAIAQIGRRVSERRLGAREAIALTRTHLNAVNDARSDNGAELIGE